MKRFKIGFLSIIAILAIGLTAATTSNLIHPATTANCTTNDYASVEIDPSGEPTSEIINSQDNCNYEVCGTFIQELSEATVGVCDENGNIFCCVKNLGVTGDCNPLTKFKVICRSDNGN